jgi:hypothetical protein
MGSQRAAPLLAAWRQIVPQGVEVGLRMHAVIQDFIERTQPVAKIVDRLAAEL